MAQTTRRTALTTTLVAASTALAGGLLAACGGNGGGAAPKSSGPVALTLWDRTTSEGYQPFIDAWLPKFNQDYSGKIALQYEPRPDSWPEKLTTAIVAGTPPDLAAVYGTWFRDAEEKSQIVALDKYIKTSKFDSADFVPGIYRAMNIHGNQVGIPQYINTNTVYINRDVFKRVGVALPSPEWTQEQLLDVAQKLTRGPLDKRDVWGLSLDPGSITGRVISLCWGAGVQYNDPKNPDVFTFDRAANVKSLQWVHDLFWRLRLAAKNDTDRSGLKQDDAFLTAGTVAMIVEGTHKIAGWRSLSTGDWDTLPLPKGPGGHGERLSMDGYAIPTGAPHPDASWTVIEEITSKDANKMRADIMGYLPARKSQFDDWTKSAPGKNLKNALPTEDAKVGPDNVWPKSKDVNDAIAPIWKKVFVTNELGVQDGLKQMQDAVAGIVGSQPK